MPRLDETASRSSGGSPELSPPDEDEIPEGFDDIAQAFSKVSTFADNLLEDINDDSMRAKQRKRERKWASSKRSSAASSSSYRYVTDSDDDTKDDNTTTRLALDHARSYQPVFDDDQSANMQSVGNESDVSSLDLTWGGDGDDSIDGSLVQDCQNLKSVTKSMREEMRRQEEAFHANVTTDNGKSFFQKLEDAQAKEDANAMKTPKVRNIARQSQLRDAPKTISIRNNSNVPILLRSAPKSKKSSLFDQLRQLCDHLLGDSPNLQLFAANLVIWLFLFKLAFAAKDELIDGDGVLRFGLAN